MIEPTVESSRTDTASLGPKRLVHDLRAPLIIAIGYLDELTIFKLRLLRQLSSEDDTHSLEVRALEIAKEVDSEISLCVDMIKESLDELDARILELRNQV